MKRPGLAMAALALAGLALAAGCGLRSGGARPVPPFRLSTLDGGTVTQEQCRDRVCVLAIWATWCPPCREEVKIFNELTARFGGDVLVLGISVDEDHEELRRFLGEVRVDYRIALAEDGFLRSLGFTGSLPFTLVVGPEGRIRLRYSGFRSSGILVEEISRLLGRSEPPPPAGERS